MLKKDYLPVDSCTLRKYELGEIYDVTLAIGCELIKRRSAMNLGMTPNDIGEKYRIEGSD